jgi:hypothetical protein
MTKHTVNLSWWLLLIFGMWLIIYVVTTLCNYYDIPSEVYMVYIVFSICLVLLKAVCDRPYAIEMDIGASLISMVMPRVQSLTSEVQSTTSTNAPIETSASSASSVASTISTSTPSAPSVASTSTTNVASTSAPTGPWSWAMSEKPQWQRTRGFAPPNSTSAPSVASTSEPIKWSWDGQPSSEQSQQDKRQPDWVKKGDNNWVPNDNKNKTP